MDTQSTTPFQAAYSALNDQSSASQEGDSFVQAYSKETGIKPDALATNQALHAGADPADLARAKAELGKKEYQGYCQSFVEQATGSGWQGSSASDAWNNAQNKVQGLQGVQPGDPVYFSDPSNPDGHVGIMDKNNSFVSATDNGVEENNINDWMNQTGQTPLGYLPKIGGVH